MAKINPSINRIVASLGNPSIFKSFMISPIAAKAVIIMFVAVLFMNVLFFVELCDELTALVGRIGLWRHSSSLEW